MPSCACGPTRSAPGGPCSPSPATCSPASSSNCCRHSPWEGPYLDCIAADALVTADIAAEEERWPRFLPAATGAGFRTVYAFPLRLMNRAVGGLNLFHRERTDLTSSQLQLGRGLAVPGPTQEHDQRRVERSPSRRSRH
ncbi:GAF domain-containing protein [Amycolatopsis sp.]|uniref:GAF domain-containing protein n=1 Tax=Amycolatopsis sp. TaxID=37632 RepID=UPI002C353B56|nr:GAF domain-containing protein [Amycolatopsis sp.]HVV09267.1 GAF domain-containing protein [Amycolatopsis sp.]